MVTAKSKDKNYSTEISNGDLSIFSDIAKERGGRGEGLRPHDLLCAGLASCLNITTRMVLDRKNIKYEEVIVKVDLDRSDENKTKFIYDIDIAGDIPSEVKEKIIDMVKNCPVRKTLSKDIEFINVNNKENEKI